MLEDPHSPVREGRGGVNSEVIVMYKVTPQVQRPKDVDLQITETFIVIMTMIVAIITEMEYPGTYLIFISTLL